jgi:NAD(P) transhydrogenase subunit beta
MLEERGAEVVYVLHPVAGRMPGHLNVLLDAANVPHENLRELAEANEEFSRTDVVVVVGANDVVNPSARISPGSPISGMPVLAVDKARDVVVLKRSLRPGFAGVDNSLFSDGRTTMLFGDVQDSLRRLVTVLRSA